MSLEYNTVILRLFTELDLLLHNYVFNGYNALANALYVPLGLSVTLYIVLLGISISQGWVQMSTGNFVKSALKISLIYTFAMNWAFFSENAIKLIQGGAGDIGSVLTSATPVPLPHFAGEGINGALQSVFIEITRIGLWIWHTGSFMHPGPFFNAIIIWGFGYVMLGIAIFEITLAKLMMAILFTLAPLFVCLTLFKSTHGIFDRWLGALMGFSLLIIFISAVLGLALNFTQWAIADIYAKQALHVSLVGFAPIMLICFMMIGVLLEVARYSKAIGGSVTTVSGSSLLAGTVGGAIGGTLATMRMGGGSLKGMKNLLKGSQNSGGGGSSDAAARSRMNAIRGNLRQNKG